MVIRALALDKLLYICYDITISSLFLRRGRWSGNSLVPGLKQAWDGLRITPAEIVALGSATWEVRRTLRTDHFLADRQPGLKGTSGRLDIVHPQMAVVLAHSNTQGVRTNYIFADFMQRVESPARLLICISCLSFAFKFMAVF